MCHAQTVRPLAPKSQIVREAAERLGLPVVEVETAVEAHEETHRAVLAERSRNLNFYRRHVYGEVLTYLVGGKAADHVRALTGRKTVTRCDRQALEGLGFTFTEVSAFTEGGSK
jgi:hypothetical protein